MEVHHHAHTARKKWSHYFWEFLMLFLAVTLGFLVENQCEYYIENHRAKVYPANMIAELKKDTFDLQKLTKESGRMCSGLDSCCVVQREHERKTGRATNGMLYFYSNFTTYGNSFSPNNATLEQLKSSGNLRYFSNTLAMRSASMINICEILKRKLRDSMFKENPPLVNQDTKLMREFTGGVKWVSGVYREQVFRHLKPLKKRVTELIGLLKKEYKLK